MLVRRVDQRRLAGSPTPHHVDVVGDRADDETVNLGARVRPDQFHVVHSTTMPRLSRARTFANVAVKSITVQ